MSVSLQVGCVSQRRTRPEFLSSATSCCHHRLPHAADDRLISHEAAVISSWSQCVLVDSDLVTRSRTQWTASRCCDAQRQMCTDKTLHFSFQFVSHWLMRCMVLGPLDSTATASWPTFQPASFSVFKSSTSAAAGRISDAHSSIMQSSLASLFFSGSRLKSQSWRIVHVTTLHCDICRIKPRRQLVKDSDITASFACLDGARKFFKQSYPANRPHWSANRINRLLLNTLHWTLQLFNWRHFKKFVDANIEYIHEATVEATIAATIASRIY